MNRTQSIPHSVPPLPSPLLDALNPAGHSRLSLQEIVTTTQEKATSSAPPQYQRWLRRVARSVKNKGQTLLIDFAELERRYWDENLQEVGKERIGQRRRFRHRSQEAEFASFDFACREVTNAPFLERKTHDETMNATTILRKKSIKGTLTAKEKNSYAGIHQRRASLRKEQEWADICIAQTLAVSIARAKERPIFSRTRGRSDFSAEFIDSLLTKTASSHTATYTNPTSRP